MSKKKRPDDQPAIHTFFGGGKAVPDAPAPKIAPPVNAQRTAERPAIKQPTVKVTPRPDGKVKVYANNFSGTTLNTTALTCADANDMIRDYLAGIPREQPPSAAPSRASSAHKLVSLASCV